MAAMKKITIKSLGEEINILKEKVKQIDVLQEKVKEIPVLKQTVKELEKTIENLERNKKKETIINNLKCRKCELNFETRRDLKEHISTDHVQRSKCQSCDKMFTKRYDLEVHMKNEHTTTEDFKCNICDKTFILEWRMLMHKKNHDNKWVKKCYYFNNNLVCPFEEMGCMFLHKNSVMCRFGEKCTKNLCPYRHRNIFQDKFGLDSRNISDEKKEENSLLNESDKSTLETFTFQTSTPKKREDQCEDCANKSECVECIVKRVRGERGGVTTASSTLAMDCSELGSAESEDCADKSECVECIVKRVREEHGWDGGVTTAQCTSTPGCSDLGASSSSASGCGGASSSFS